MTTPRALGAALLQQLPVIHQLAVALDRRLADAHKLLALKYLPVAQPLPICIPSWPAAATYSRRW